MKLERFKERDNKKIGVIVFTLICLFLISGAILYRTFAIFEVRTNQNIINGTVQAPGNIYFAFYVNDGKEDKILLIMVMISMPLLKDTGLLLLGIILMQLFFSKVIMKIIEDKKITKDILQKFGILILVLFISLTLYGTWKLYCKINDKMLDDRHDKNSISQIDIKSYIKAVTLYEIEERKI